MIIIIQWDNVYPPIWILFISQKSDLALLKFYFLIRKIEIMILTTSKDYQEDGIL